MCVAINYLFETGCCEPRTLNGGDGSTVFKLPSELVNLTPDGSQEDSSCPNFYQIDFGVDPFPSADVHLLYLFLKLSSIAVLRLFFFLLSKLN